MSEVYASREVVVEGAFCIVVILCTTTRESRAAKCLSGAENRSLSTQNRSPRMSKCPP